MDLIERIADYVLETDPDDIPSDDLKIAKTFLLDSIGVGFAGSTAMGVSSIVKQLSEWGGKKEARLIAFPNKLPAPWAAYANALMIHARDFDDVHDVAGIHANAPVLGALLAVSELSGREVSGKDFLSAQIIGVDLAVRLAISVPHRKSGWHASSVFGIMGAVAAGGRILELTKEELINAFGIAYSQMSGNRQCMLDNALTKRMQPAFAAQNAVISLFYAKKGIQGAKNIIEGKYGLGSTYFNQALDKECFLQELGRYFEIRRLAIKPYPCCRGCHAAIDAALELRKQEEWIGKKLESIRVLTSMRTKVQIGGPINPHGMTHVGAQFSIPYTVATAWLKGKVGLDDFIGPALNDQQILELSGKVEVDVDPDLPNPMMGIPQTIQFKAVDGQKSVMVVSHRTGCPEKPLSDQGIMAKFENCLKFSREHISDERASGILNSIMNIECSSDFNKDIHVIYG